MIKQINKVGEIKQTNQKKNNTLKSLACGTTSVQAVTWYTIKTIPISGSCGSSSISTSVTISVRIRQRVGLSVASIELFFKNAQQAGDPVVQTHVQDELE